MVSEWLIRKLGNKNCLSLITRQRASNGRSQRTQHVLHGDFAQYRAGGERACAGKGWGHTEVKDGSGVQHLSGDFFFALETLHRFFSGQPTQNARLVFETSCDFVNLNSHLKTKKSLRGNMAE